MPREYGMYDIDDAWDWQPRRGHQTPDRPNRTQVPAESIAQKPVDLVTEVVKSKFIEVSIWLTQNKKPGEMTPAEASAVARGRMYLAERTPKSAAVQAPASKLDLEKFTTVAQAPRASREALLTR